MQSISLCHVFLFALLVQEFIKKDNKKLTKRKCLAIQRQGKECLLKNGENEELAAKKEK